ncbi:MAG: hypothetical protein D6738_10060 [Acidobacteria bacterium]|nr:MAG: hypothetical protein D6738_10060 [Acidobacteriota bacterium]
MTDHRHPPASFREPAPPGRTTLDLDLGLLTVRLVDLPAPWDPFVAWQLAPFATPAGEGGADPDLVVACREGAGPVVPLPGHPGAPTVLEIGRDPAGGAVRVRSHWLDGRFDRDAGAGELVLTDRRWDLFAASLENFLRVVVQHEALVRRRGRAALVHAAALLDEQGRAVLLAGRSGDGKSTATRLSGRPALSDDVALVSLDGPAGTPEAIAVPFYMVGPPDARPRGRFPIASVVRLRKADAVSVTPISPAQVAALLASLIPFAGDLGMSAAERAAFAGEVARAVEGRELGFGRESGWWGEWRPDVSP